MSDQEFAMEVCSGGTSWQVFPDKECSLDIITVSDRIVEAGWIRTLENRLCHTFSGEVDLTLFPSGRLLIKSRDKNLANSIARVLVTDWLLE